MALLYIQKPGLQTFVVDLGRPATRSLGVPLGGAADQTAFGQGNAALGNDLGAAALEFCLAGPTLVTDASLPCAITGAPFDILLGEEPLSVPATFTLPANIPLRILGTTRGARGYLCIGGGIQTQPILGSRSSLEALRAGDRLPCNSGRIAAGRLPVCSSLETDRLRIVPGRQADWFETGLDGHIFTVSTAANRIGVRLVGEPIQPPRKEMTSEPVCPGTIQVTNDGQCIILGVDAQTIGGYPKIAHVIRADLDKIGQLRAGQTLRFERISSD